MSDSDRTPVTVAPGGVIGILGGGQLGRMLSMAAAQLGLRVCVLSPEANSPAAQVSEHTIVAPYTNEAALTALHERCAVITYEFENVPSQTVAFLQKLGAIVRPGAIALEKAQDRLIEKQFIASLGAKTAAFHAIDDLVSLEAGLIAVGRPAILKTRRLGYDGKGQTRITDEVDDLPDAFKRAIKYAWNEVGAAPSILEAFVDFEREISVIGARAENGDISLFDPAENIHENGILKTSTAPSAASAQSIERAQTITAQIMKALNYIGVMGVEFFDIGGDVVVNEFAPRVHNSGHWTSDACPISQFEQHIRAVAGWPLGDGVRHSDAIMENVIGREADKWRGIVEIQNSAIHLYGKRIVRDGRKMGHITHIAPRKD